MEKKKYIVQKYAGKLRNRNLKSMVIMTLFQLADDEWFAFVNDTYAKSVYSVGAMKEISSEFSRVRTCLKNQFRSQGKVHLFDDMMGEIADKADVLEPIAKRFRNDIYTVLIRFMPYAEVNAFSIAVASGTMLLLANDAYTVGSDTACRFFGDIAVMMDKLLSRVELWRDVTGCGSDEIADRLFKAVLNEAERGIGDLAQEPKSEIVRRPGYRTAPLSFLDEIAKRYKKEMTAIPAR